MFLITGSTGNVGAELVSALVAAGRPVRALVRTPPATPAPGVEPVVGDLDDPASFADALAGVDGLFLLPGYADAAGLLARAAEHGVRRVVLLSGGSAATGDLDNAVSRYMILAERDVQASGLEWTIVRSRAFMSNALRWREQLAAGDVVRVPFGGVRAAAIDPYDIAAVAARALLEDGHAGRIHEVTGPESLLPAEQVAVLADVLGRDLRCVALTDEEARRDMEAQMPVEYVDAFFSFYVDGTLDESQVLPTVQEVTGRQPRTFRDWARAHAGAFR